jgi:hypothetical protein
MIDAADNFEAQSQSIPEAERILFLCDSIIAQHETLPSDTRMTLPVVGDSLTEYLQETLG